MKFSLVNPHVTLVPVWPGHESWWNCPMSTLSYRVSCNSCSRLTLWTWELMKLSCNLSLVNSHATVVLVWQGHESWWNSHANSRWSTLTKLLFPFDEDMRVDENFHCQLSLINFHETLEQNTRFPVLQPNLAQHNGRKQVIELVCVRETNLFKNIQA